MDNLTIAYIIFGIVLLHLIVGFAWVIYKFMKPKKKNGVGEEKSTEQD